MNRFIITIAALLFTATVFNGSNLRVASFYFGSDLRYYQFEACEFLFWGQGKCRLGRTRT